MGAFDEKIQQIKQKHDLQDSLGAAALQSYNTNPDAYAKQVQLSRKSGLPVDVLPDLTDDAKMRVLSGDFRDLPQKAPATAKFLTEDQRAARLMLDQTEEMGTVERTVRNLAAGFGGDFVGSGMHGMGKALHSLERLTGSKSITADFFENVGETTKKYWQDIAPKDRGGEMLGIPTDSIVRGIGQIPGQIALLSNPFTAPAGLGMMIGQGSDQMAEKIEKDKKSQQASQVAQDVEILSGGAITGITEFLTGKLLLHPPQVLAIKNKLANYIARVAVGTAEEGIQELSENIGQDLAHIAMTNPDSKIAFGEALEAGGVGAVVGAVTSALINGALHVRTRGKQQAFADLSDATKAQKVRDRDPETYNGYTNSVARHLAETSDGAVENIYIDANTFGQVMTDAQQNPTEVLTAMGIDPQVYEEAKATGGDVVIPLGDFAGKVAGTEIGDALNDHLRSTPDSLSISELEAMGNMAGSIQQQAEAIMAKQEQRDEWRKSANEVQSTVAEQLKATGVYSPAAVRSYSPVVRAFYEVMADKQGVTPSELYAQHPYKVVSGEIGQGEVTQDRRRSFIYGYNNDRRTFSERLAVPDKYREHMERNNIISLDDYGIPLTPEEAAQAESLGFADYHIKAADVGGDVAPIELKYPYRLRPPEGVRDGTSSLKLTEDQKRFRYELLGNAQDMMRRLKNPFEQSDSTPYYQSTFAGMSAQAQQIADSLGMKATEGALAPSDLLYSTRTWTQEEKAQISELAKEMGIEEDKVAKWMYDIDNAMARVLADPSLDFIAEAADLYSALKPNSDPHYTVSLDFSTLCRKRYELIATIEAIQNLTGRALTKETWVEVREKLDAMGYNVSCGACYVDSKRMESGKFVNKFIDEHPEEDPKQFLSQAGIDQLKRDKPELYAEFKKAIGANNAKTPESRTDYHGEIREYFVASSAGKNRVEATNKKSGLRWQSWSDFEVPHLLDAMQAILDMHLAGLKGHAYTKVPDFVLAMGKTGLMVNMSLIPKGTGLAEDGKLIFDSKEGMDFDIALELRDAHETTAGTIAIGVSNEHIKALLADPRIDYVIPYHASGLSKEIAKKFNMDGWEDYTDTQTEDIGDWDLFHKITGKKNEKLAELWKGLQTLPKQRQKKMAPLEKKVAVAEQAYKAAQANTAAAFDARVAAEDARKSADKAGKASARQAEEKAKQAHIDAKADEKTARDAFRKAEGKRDESAKAFQTIEDGIRAEYRDTAKKAGLVGIEIYEYWNDTKSGPENAKAYLELAASRGIAPKFRGKEYASGRVLADLTQEEGYWKLLIDRKMYDHSGNPIVQQAVKPQYDMDAINKIYDEAAENPVPNAAVPEVVEQFTGKPYLAQSSTSNKRGGFNPESLTTILTQQSDYSTFLHETAHFFLTTYANVAMGENASPAIQQDMQTLLDWFGVKDLDAWNAMTLEQQRPFHEQFAYNYEIYLFEGKAPSPKMQTLFDRFTAWLKKVYSDIRGELNAVYRQEHGTDLPILTGEVRDVMDRMLASDEQIKQAEAVRGMAPIFQTKPETMTDEEWAAYQEMQQEAHDAALAEHTKASLRQMKWLEGAKSRVLKELQAQAKEEREAIRNEVRKEVEGYDNYRAFYAWDNARNAIERAAILDAFGYESEQHLEQSRAASPNKEDLIKSMTDQRMLEEHGELTDPKAMQAAVDRAVHNEARAKFIGVELRHLAKSTRPVRLMQEAARQAARAILGKQAIGKIRPHDYAAAEARAAANAEKAMKEGDTAAATQFKEHQLLQNQLASEALKAKSEVATALESFKKVFASDKRLAKGRDMNYVNTARAILAHYGIGQSEKPAGDYLKTIKSYDPEFFAEIEPLFTAHEQTSKPITDLTLDEFRDLADQVQSLWHLSRRTKQIEIDGQLRDRKEVVAELKAVIEERAAGKSAPGTSKAFTEAEERKVSLLGIMSALRRVEHWCEVMDNGAANGAFRRYIWNPINEAVNKYNLAKLERVKAYQNLLKEYEHLFRAQDVVADELGYTFTAKELMHVILHTGNESNKKKLLLGGRGDGHAWADVREDGSIDYSRWESFRQRAMAEGLITRDHYELAQKIWDMMESFKADAQKAHREMYGFYFAEITANPVETPWGVYAGGYVPAKTDPRLVAKAAQNVEQETQMMDTSFAFPTTGRGATMKRVENYTKPLLLDMSTVASHIDWALRFSYIEPRIKDVARMVGTTNRGFTDAMQKLDQTIQTDMLVPWLQRTAQQQATMASRGKMGKALDTAFNFLRVNTGFQMMVGNVVNAVQQLTGFAVASVKVPPGKLMLAIWRYTHEPSVMAEEVQAKSDFMRSRMNEDQFNISRAIDRVLVAPTQMETVRDFAEKHGYFLQQGLQNVMDVMIWSGSYDSAIEAGMSEKDAVRKADSDVRMTQEARRPSDISRAETGSPFVRMFTQFYSYFNNQANLLAGEFINTARNFGVKKGGGRMLYVAALGYMIPAYFSEVIAQAFRGFDLGDDDEWGFDDAFKLFFSSQWKYGSAMLPGIGQLMNAGVNKWNDKPYDDKLSVSPVMQTLESVAFAPNTIYKAVVEDGSSKKAAKDALTIIGLATRLPLGQVGKTAGYVLDVEEGKASPESGMDVARGLLTGSDVNRKK